MNILITGGAGYIGSHMVLRLLEAGHQVSIVDDLSTGHQALVKNLCAGQQYTSSSAKAEDPQKIGLSAFADNDDGFLDKNDDGFLDKPENDPFYFFSGAKDKQLDVHIFNIANKKKLSALFAAKKFDAVMHFAAFIAVGESVENPAKYYENNVANTLSLLNTMCAHDVKNLIFSSTAAIFGEPQYTPLDLKHPKNPVNPYGRSKLMIEHMLEDFDHAYGLKSVCLRYFNAAGADPELRTGECHEPETHLIPLLLQVAAGKRDHIKVFGRDYATTDGTCIRDYIHIYDLCSAHLNALDYLKKQKHSAQFNLGNGKGYSVQEVINAAEKITGQKIKTVDASRRAGDPAVLIADASAAKAELSWTLKYPDIETIIAHAWGWENKNS